MWNEYGNYVIQVYSGSDENQGFIVVVIGTVYSPVQAVLTPFTRWGGGSTVIVPQATWAGILLQLQAIPSVCVIQGIDHDWYPN